MTPIITLLSGAVAMTYFIAALFFVKFWRRTRDFLFLAFAAAFWLLSLNQALVGVFGEVEARAAFYSLRLVGFVLIIIAIAFKNLKKS